MSGTPRTSDAVAASLPRDFDILFGMGEGEAENHTKAPGRTLIHCRGFAKYGPRALSPMVQHVAVSTRCSGRREQPDAVISKHLEHH